MTQNKIITTKSILFRYSVDSERDKSQPQKM